MSQSIAKVTLAAMATASGQPPLVLAYAACPSVSVACEVNVW